MCVYIYTCNAFLIHFGRFNHFYSICSDSVIENRFYDRECNDITAEKVSKILQTDDFLWEGSRILVQPTTADGSDVELESIIVHLEDENRFVIADVKKWS